MEFALVVVLLLPLLLAIAEFGRAFYMVQVIQNAAREGARVAATSTDDAATRRVLAEARIEGLLESVDFRDYQIEFPNQGSWGFGRPVEVVVKQPFVSLAGAFIPILEGEIELEVSAVFNMEMPLP